MSSRVDAAAATSRSSSGTLPPRVRPPLRAPSAAPPDGDARVAGDPEAQGQVPRARDADARPARDREVARPAGRQDHEEPPREVGAVVAQRQPERLREVAGTAGRRARGGGRKRGGAAYARASRSRTRRASES